MPNQAAILVTRETLTMWNVCAPDGQGKERLPSVPFVFLTTALVPAGAADQSFSFSLSPTEGLGRSPLVETPARPGVAWRNVVRDHL